MTQYINKDDLVEEITNLKVKFDCGWNCAIDKVLEHIDDLEAKDVDLEKESEWWIEENQDTVGFFDLIDYAKHFF